MQTLTMKLLLSLNKDLYRALADEADMVEEKMRNRRKTLLLGIA
jgi:hypothetical protein